MAVLRLRQSRLSYLVAKPGYEDDNGDYHPGENFWDGNIECGYSPAGAANEIRFDDGSVKVYTYTLSLPRDCRDFSIGDRVRIELISGRWQEFTVKSFLRYQLQCKMWI